MAKIIYDMYNSSRQIFKRCNKILGHDITDLMFNGNEEDLGKTKNSQPAIFISNMAYLQALKENNVDCSVVMGHSLGEYSALVAADSLSLDDAMGLIKKRAELITECIPKEKVKWKTTHMAAVLTKDDSVFDEVYDACNKFSLPESTVEIANINSPNQIVISGHNSAVVKAVNYLKKLKKEGVKKVVYLKVEGPFHSSIMKPAEKEMGIALEKVIIKEPKIPYIANYTASIVTKSHEIKELLVKQISGTVQWYQSLENVIKSGVKDFVESGFGKVQSNLLNYSYGDKVRVLDTEAIVTRA